MTFLVSILFFFVILSGCDRADEPAAPAEAPDRSENAAANKPVEVRPGTAKPLESVMRPSVVAESDAKEPAAPPEPAKIVISFGQSGTALSEEGRSALDALLATPVAAAQSTIIIRGHSDSKGSDAQNLAASQKRAEAVRDYLLERGMPKSRITLIALGETRPIAPNATPEGLDFEQGRRKNRRAEVEISAAPPKQR